MRPQVTSRQGSCEFVFVSSSGIKVVLSRCRERERGREGTRERGRERGMKVGKKEKDRLSPASGRTSTKPKLVEDGALRGQFSVSEGVHSPLMGDMVGELKSWHRAGVDDMEGTSWLS